MNKLNFGNRLGISLAIILGNTSGRFGTTTVCHEFVQADGGPVYHKASWHVDLASGEEECEGTVRLRK